jgi:hypothetical protein
MPSGTARPRTIARTPGMPDRMVRFRFIDGDAAAAGTAGAATETATVTPATVAAAIQTQQAAPAAASASTWDGKVESLDPAVQKMIADLRAENAASRTNAKATAAEEARKALIDDLGKTLGLVKDGDETPDANALATQLAEQQAAARAAQVELAVFRAAGPAGADAAALLDSRTFLDSVKDADPADAAAITAAITKALADNPRLKAAQVAAKSGADLTGGTGEGTSNTPLPMAEAVSRTMAGQ